jgi:hypothetical protein
LIIRILAVLAAALPLSLANGRFALAAEPAITTYGERSPLAPEELGAFAFMVGKWNGLGSALRADGSEVQIGMTWIGRYVLDGTAIADEFHATAPDGKPYLGITLRQFSPQRGWVIEYLNVSASFLRRQVNSRSGAVSVEADAVVVISEDGASRIREQYRVLDDDHFTYAMDMSRDGGSTWDPVSVQLSMTRTP